MYMPPKANAAEVRHNLLVAVILADLEKEYANTGDVPGSGWYSAYDAEYTSRRFRPHTFTDTEILDAMEKAFMQFDDSHQGLNGPDPRIFIPFILTDLIQPALAIVATNAERRAYTQWARQFLTNLMQDRANHIGAHTLVTGRDFRQEIGLPRDLWSMEYIPTGSELHRWRRDNPEAAALNDPNDPVAYDEWMWMETSSRGDRV
jgi:hypothetical protein